MFSYLEKLNQSQAEAVTHQNGPLLVLAGAGTGKTRTLTYRILHLTKQGINPANILALTFTNKATKEMRERISEMLDFKDGLPFTSTFHALGTYLLRNFHDRVDIKKHFTILDNGDSIALLKEAMDKAGVNPKDWDPKQVRHKIGLATGQGLTPNDWHQSGSATNDILAPVWEEYNQLKKQQHSLDFSDLLSKTHKLLKTDSEVRELLQNRWHYIHVDEYQDTNQIQYEICKLILNDNQNICAVGDNDQTIYSWRGATIRNIMQFEQDFPGATIITLEKNYRSTKNILSVAHEIIRHNPNRYDKQLTSDGPEGELVTVYQAVSATDEAGWVAKEIKHLLSEGTLASDICVLYRTNFQSRVLEEALLRQKIPYQLLGTKFFERKEVKDVLAYLRFAINEESLADLKRIINEPKRGIGATSIAKIISGQADQLTKQAQQSFSNFKQIITQIQNAIKEKSPSETIEQILLISGLSAYYQTSTRDEQDRYENIKELVSFAKQYDNLPINEGVIKLLEDSALLGEQDNLKDASVLDAVRLMTIHASKGLEFKVVFVVGMEQGLFPSDRSEDNRDKEEERRLCYVAFTRAKEKLYLSWAQIRKIFGQDTIQSPSEFLNDIPEHLIASEYVFEKYDENGGTNYLDW